MIQAIISDMDGVLVNTEPLYEEVVIEVLKEVGIQEVPPLIAGRSSDQYWTMLKELYQFSEDALELRNQARVKIREKIKQEIKPLPGVYEFFTAAQGKVKLGLATNASSGTANSVLKATRLRNFFEVVITRDMVARPKPNPEIYLMAAKQLGVKPNDCMVFEDSDRGVQAAKAAGMKCIAIKPKGIECAHADKTIQSFSEITVEELMQL